MSDIDPLKVVRNPETLRAYRAYQRAVRRAGQPWFAIALVAGPVAIALELYGLFHLEKGLARGLLPALAVLISGLASAIAAYRMWRFRRSHPIELPEPRPDAAWDAKSSRLTGVDSSTR